MTEKNCCLRKGRIGGELSKKTMLGLPIMQSECWELAGNILEAQNSPDLGSGRDKRGNENCWEIRRLMENETLGVLVL